MFLGTSKIIYIFAGSINLLVWFKIKNYHPVSLLPVVSKVFEKLVNNRSVDCLESLGLLQL